MIAKNYNLLLLAALVATPTLRAWDTQKTALVIGGTVGTVLLSKYVYDNFIKERTDVEEIAYAERIIDEAQADYDKFATEFAAAQPFVQASIDASEFCSFIKSIAHTYTGYKKLLDTAIDQLSAHEEHLISCKQQVLHRSIRLQQCKEKNSAAESLIKRYTELEKQAQQCKALIVPLLNQLHQLRNHLVQLPTYIIENLDTRVQELENYVYTYPRYLYFPRPAWNED